MTNQTEDEDISVVNRLRAAVGELANTAPTRVLRKALVSAVRGEEVEPTDVEVEDALTRFEKFGGEG